MNRLMNIKLAIVALFVPIVMLNARQKAVVNVSAAYLRVAPDYESALDSQELMGRVAEILDRDRYWVKVATSQPDTAWVNERQLAILDEAGIEAWESSPKYVVTALSSSVYASPRRDSGILCPVSLGNLLRQDGKARSGMVPVRLPDSRRGWIPAADVMREAVWEAECRTMDPGRKCNVAISHAERMLGTAYMWGGMSAAGCDCSGLVRLCYLMAGVSLPRNSSQQYRAGRDIPVGRNDDGSFDLSALRRGDLVFFGSETPEKLRITHVGIYLGGGRMIQSSQLVRINSLNPADGDCYENAWRLVRACRIVE